MASVAEMLFTELLKHHEEIHQNRGISIESISEATVRRSVISYQSLCEKIKIPFTPNIESAFGDIASRCKDNGLPPLAALAVDAKTKMPNFRYLGYATVSNANAMAVRWIRQVRECIASDSCDQNLAAKIFSASKKKMPSVIRVRGNPTMTVTAWNNGGEGFGFKVAEADRDQCFSRDWSFIELTLPSQSRPIVINIDKKSFWNSTCHELIHKEIGKWFKSSKHFPWPKRKPPKFTLAQTMENSFVVREQLPV